MNSSFKKNILLFGIIVMIMAMSTPVFAVSRRYKAYGKTVKKLEKTYGKGKTKRYNGRVYNTGVCYLKLIDLDKDGKNELLVVHSDKKATKFNVPGYDMRIYGYKRGKAKCLYKDDAYMGGLFSIYVSTLNKKGKTYVATGGYYWDGHDTQTFVTVKKNKLVTAFSYKMRDRDKKGRYTRKIYYYVNGKSKTMRAANNALSNWYNGATDQERYKIYPVSAAENKNMLKNMKKVRKQLGLK